MIDIRWVFWDYFLLFLVIEVPNRALGALASLANGEVALRLGNIDEVDPLTVVRARQKCLLAVFTLLRRV
jgi:hypothetical protein